MSFCNVKTRIAMRNSSASQSLKLETNESNMVRGSWEAVAGVRCHSWGRRPGRFGVLAFDSQASCVRIAQDFSFFNSLSNI